jgi:hypothetical protein
VKYRIAKCDDEHRVQYRPNWWPFWITETRYRNYDNPVGVAQRRITELKLKAAWKNSRAKVIHTE